MCDVIMGKTLVKWKETEKQQLVWFLFRCLNIVNHQSWTHVAGCITVKCQTTRYYTRSLSQTHIHHKDHLTGHVNTQNYTHTHTLIGMHHTHAHNSSSVSLTLSHVCWHAHLSALFPQRHRKHRVTHFYQKFYFLWSLHMCHCLWWKNTAHVERWTTFTARLSGEKSIWI